MCSDLTTSIPSGLSARKGGFHLDRVPGRYAIFGMLAEMLIPAFASAKLKARGVHCINSFKQL